MGQVRGGCVVFVTLLVMNDAQALGDKNHPWSLQGSWAIVPTTPLEIGNQRQLLMDDYVVEDRRACRRIVHQPEKHAANPLFSTGPGGLCPDRSFNYLSVQHDDQSGLYRVWISSSVQIEQPTPPGFYWLTRGRYYESDDGIHWRAPELGLVEVDGSRANNVFLGGSQVSYDSVGVSCTPPNWRSRGRYMMIYNQSPAGRGPHHHLPAGGQQIRLAFGDDGIHWRDQKENPIFRGQSDTANNVCFNEKREAFMYYRRPPINAGEIRRIAYSESSDLIHWTQPEHVVVPDELDSYSLYCMPVTRYQGVYLGFLHMFYSRLPLHRRGETDKHMKIDVQLAWSRDGKNWHRHPRRPVFLKTGRQGSYDQGMVYAGKGIIEHDDRIDIYYTGHENLHISTMPGESHLCLASLRRDGFVSLDAPDEGNVLTKPIRCPGGQLHINARTKPGGAIHVAVRHGDGELDGVSRDEWNYDRCRVFEGDAIDHVIEWCGDEDLDTLKDKAIRLEFSLVQAELFSFWFE